jgi:hypothetical protein
VGASSCIKWRSARWAWLTASSEPGAEFFAPLASPSFEFCSHAGSHSRTDSQPWRPRAKGLRPQRQMPLRHAVIRRFGLAFCFQIKSELTSSPLGQRGGFAKAPIDPSASCGRGHSRDLLSRCQFSRRPRWGRSILLHFRLRHGGPNGPLPQAICVGSIHPDLSAVPGRSWPPIPRIPHAN